MTTSTSKQHYNETLAEMSKDDGTSSSLEQYQIFEKNNLEIIRDVIKTT